jgi:hypothetical protein
MEDSDATRGRTRGDHLAHWRQHELCSSQPSARYGTDLAAGNSRLQFRVAIKQYSARRDGTQSKRVEPGAMSCCRANRQSNATIDIRRRRSSIELDGANRVRLERILWIRRGASDRRIRIHDRARQQSKHSPRLDRACYSWRESDVDGAGASCVIKLSGRLTDAKTRCPGGGGGTDRCGRGR